MYPKKAGRGFWLNVLFKLFSPLETLAQASSYITNTEAKHRDFERQIERENLRLNAADTIQYFRLNIPAGT
jgi:hypothetical protein